MHQPKVNGLDDARGDKMLKKDKAKAPIAGFLVVRKLDEALKFYKKVFGAEETERYKDPRGKVWYAVAHVQGVPLQLMEPFTDMGLVAAPKRPTRGDSSMLSITVDDVDDTFKKAMKAGGTPIIEPQVAYWGDRYAEFRDISGQRWACCGKVSLEDEVSNPAQLTKKFNNFLEEHNNPRSPAKAVGVKNVNVQGR
jgi:PhnB protein